MIAIQTRTLVTAVGLFDKLNDQGIRYCAWKSTHELDKGLRGGTDVDLLLDRAEAGKFRQILQGCDFKPFVSAPQRQYPAVEDYLGFDRQSGAIIHLHVHYRLIIGDQYTKNYVLPLEQSFLDHTRMKSGVRVPAAELETIILSLRVLLKYSDRNVIRDLFRLPGRSGIAQSFFKEFDELLALTNLDQIKTAIERDIDFVPTDLVLNFLKTLKESPRDAWVLFHLRRRVRELLLPYERMAWVQTELEYHRTALIQKLPSKRLRDYLLADRHKKPSAGGLGIAFIGADGAGKSTCVKEIIKWLNWRVNVHKFYMGTTHPSTVTKMVRAILGLGQKVHAGTKRILGIKNPITRAANGFENLLTDFSFVAEAHDRYDRYEKGQRKIAQGAVVIYDRYPLKAAMIDGRPMDGPRIRAKGNPSNKLSANLAQREENLYRKIRPPDRMVVLRVSPEVSQARKPEHRRERIEAKARALDGLDSSDTKVLMVDAEQPLEQVLLQVKTAIWSWL
ncbi:MAG: hypothetical protein HZB51_08565 [Chloroflexi bacterium]|nr:hypothetical protein [Chloroflexota bacterium]